MPKLLIVDDEPHYRNELTWACDPQRHEVRVAASGRQAIDLGVRFRPDVLITDWLLGNHVHGLHVAQALRVVDPRLRTILITAFASGDLRKEAASCPIVDFLEKPFDVAGLEKALAHALAAKAPPGDELPAGILDVDREGRILYVNRRAGEMLAAAGVDRAPTLDDVFGLAMRAALAAADERWCVVAPRVVDFVPWWLRVRRWADGGALIVFLRAEHEQYKEHPLVRILLGLTYRAHLDWPFDGNVLIVDRSEVVRRVFTAELEHAGRTCHAAESGAVGLELFRKDPEIGLVVVDYHLPDVKLADFLQHLGAIRPGVPIVGCGEDDRRAAFARLGVTRYVSKPFVLEDFVELHGLGNGDGAAGPRNGHPLVRKAVRYIDRHLANAELTVEGVARHAGVNATYLGHLFSKHAGIRMSRYIAMRRVELAKSLLATTDWQVKRVAFATGHRNANWFTEVFRHFAGSTPSEFRRSLKEG